jgi:hypothetical protein
VWVTKEVQHSLADTRPRVGAAFKLSCPVPFLFLKAPFSQSLGSESATHIMHWSLLQQREKCKNIRNKFFVLKQRLSWHLVIIIFMLYANLSPISLTYMYVRRSRVICRKYFDVKVQYIFTLITSHVGGLLAVFRCVFSKCLYTNPRTRR